jgi:hypothetical protein
VIEDQDPEPRAGPAVVAFPHSGAINPGALLRRHFAIAPPMRNCDLRFSWGERSGGPPGTALRLAMCGPDRNHLVRGGITIRGHGSAVELDLSGTWNTE